MSENEDKKFNTFSEFYPYYLEEHKDKTNIKLHFAGSLLVILILLIIIITKNWVLLLLMPIVGYGFAWIGHYFFERNKPATFKYPLYSLMGDWVMFKDVIVGKVKL